MSVFVIIVTYNPEHNLLMRQYESIRKQVSGIVYVDNCSTNLVLPEGNMVFHILNRRNEGLGKAQNQGIALARQKGATHILLLDQDSVASPFMVDTLLAVEKENRKHRMRVGLVAPGILDVLSCPPVNLDAILFQGIKIKHLKLEQATLPVSYCIASGSLISMEVLDCVGLMKEELFIDSLDVEWCLRAKSLGYEILMTPKTFLKHQLGTGNKDRILSHNPIREYYICRNNMILLSFKHIPLGYKVRKIIFTPLRILHSLFHRQWQYLKAELEGVLDGISRKNRYITNE